jgi:putative addiction module component (TIGR02574 family)
MEKMGIDQLSVEERLLLIQEIWDSIGQDQLPPLSDAQRQELERRLEEDDANPEDVVPWEQVKAESLARCSK